MKGGRTMTGDLQFTSGLFEPSFQDEYSLISEEQRSRSSALFNKRGMINNYSQINLYLYAGIGGVFFNPKVNDAMKNASAIMIRIIQSWHCFSGRNWVKICYQPELVGRSRIRDTVDHNRLFRWLYIRPGQRRMIYIILDL